MKIKYIVHSMKKSKELWNESIIFENKRSKITRERQMLLIRTEKYELWLRLDDNLQAAYKFRKWPLHYLSEL
jgi:hypothetical protein